MSKNMNGRVVWEGYSMIDGSPIVVIVTGFKDKSANGKTGDMLQTWILRRDVNPVEAINTGADFGICGDCPLRGRVEADGCGSVNRGRSCYVNVHQAPLAVWNCYDHGAGYPEMGDDDWKAMGDRFVRLGSYGDVAAVPYWVMKKIADAGKGYTGYTHQWRDGEFWRFRKIAMASVETLEQTQEASQEGWRTFRTMRKGEEPAAGEFRCPASKEAGNRLECAQCKACDGTDRLKGDQHAASVAINVHGGPSILGSYSKKFDA